MAKGVKTPWYDQITFKDGVLTVICLLSFLVHYLLSQAATRETIMELRGDLKVIHNRLDNLEGNAKPTNKQFPVSNFERDMDIPETLKKQIYASFTNKVY